MLAVIFDSTNRGHVLHYAGCDDIAREFRVDLDAWHREYKPAAFAMAFDGPESRAWRQQILPEYKAHRPVNEEARGAVFAAMQESLACGLPVFCVPGYEADDLIGGLLERWFARGGTKAVVVSSDGDMVQYLRPGKVSICKRFARSGDGSTMVKPQFVTAANWEAENVPLSQWLWWRAIVGDQSDGLRGLDGVGEARAKKLLAVEPDPGKSLAAPQCLPEPARKSWSEFLERSIKLRQVIAAREVPQAYLDECIGEPHLYEPWK